jgi:hypothetical protein
VITADALHCQREHASWLHAHGGHYLFTVKANQPRVRRAVAALPWAQVPGSRRRQAGHGRTESRSIKVVDLDGHRIQALFPHVQRAIKVVRRRRCRPTGKRSVKTVYAVTSLNHRHADPGLLGVWIQGHWDSRTGCTTSGMSPRVRTARVPRRLRASSRPCETSRSTLHRPDGRINIASAQRGTAWRAGAALRVINAA